MPLKVKSKISRSKISRSKISRSKPRYSRKRVSNQKRRSKLRKNTRKKSRAHTPVKRRTNTYRRNSQKGGADMSHDDDNVDDDDIIMKTIAEKSDDLCILKGSECHKSDIGLLLIIDENYSKIPIDIEWNNITKYIDDGSHLILKITSSGHVWFLEIKNHSFRILSLWSGSYGFYEYYNSNKYGKFNDKSELDGFLELLTELNGIDIYDTSIKQGIHNTDDRGKWLTTERLKKSYAAQEILFNVRQYTDEFIEKGVRIHGDDINSGMFYRQPPTIIIVFAFLLEKKQM